MKNKHIFWISQLVIMGAFLILTNCYKKDENNINTTPAIKIPVLTSSGVVDITKTSATCGGNITSDGGASITARGVCWSINANPTIVVSKTTDGTGTGAFTSSITGLTINTSYYVRAYATNIAGTGYGNEVTFTTTANSEPGTITDIEGNVYHSITIGTQVWMVENLKTTKYNDGTTIPLVTLAYEWSPSNTPGYCFYKNDAATYKSTYGALYNWMTINTGKLCPTGWHVPSDVEWNTLATFLGGRSVAGGKLKSTGTTLWLFPNTGATNETGFSALPGGYRNAFATFNDVGKVSWWWSSTDSGTFEPMNWCIYNDYSLIDRNFFSKRYGFSVRCLRDF